MHPAKSVIFFTTASGAGYGLLIWIAVFAAMGWIPADRGFGFLAFALSLGLITAGLMSSTFHLGHPERAWRAMSQWRTSWLSREGVVAVVTYIPAGLFAALWVFGGVNGGVAVLLGLVAAVLAVVTTYCTAMIYASLKTIHAWSNGYTITKYIVFSLMSGALIFNALAHVWGFGHLAVYAVLCLLLLAAGLAVKFLYWGHIDATRSASTAESATGLGEWGKVRLLESPHTQDNYLLTEMGYRIARKHAAKLRLITFATAFILPAMAIALSIFAQGMMATLLAVVAVLIAAVGIATERWLFFAEAKHTVTLYYGQATA